MQTGVADLSRDVVAVDLAEGGVVGAGVEVEEVVVGAGGAVGIGVADAAGGGAGDAGGVERVGAERALGAGEGRRVEVPHSAGEALGLAETGAAGEGAALAGQGRRLRVVGGDGSDGRAIGETLVAVEVETEQTVGAVSLTSRTG